MHPAATWFSAGLLVLTFSAAGCMTPPNPPPSEAAQVGSASGSGEANDALPYTPPSTVHPPPLKNAHVDQAQSQKLSDYLKAHHLPLVGAQVMAAPSGQRQVILFGYVRTDYGKGDAESKTRRYINDSAVTVDNRIKIEPALANLNPKQSPEAQPGDAQPGDSQAGDAQAAGPVGVSGVEAYEQQRYEEQLQQQQIYGYQAQNPSGLSMVVPFLGLFGGSFGGGGIGFGSGGFGGGYGAYRPYPSAPPPSSYPPAYPYP